MSPYKFVITVEPKPDNPHFLEVGGAYAHFIIFDGEPDAALMRAKAYLSANHWDPQTVEFAAPFPARRLSEFCESERHLFERANRQGFAVDFEAWAKN